MKIFVSSLIRGMGEAEQVALWANSLDQLDVGVELIAFTHDDAYWNRLQATLEQLTCPVTFHGPYIKTEGTSLPGSEEQQFLLASYERVFRLAQQYKVSHVVYHTTQKNFPTADNGEMRRRADANACLIMDMAKSFGVTVLVENLPWPKERFPVYDCEQYADFFRRFPDASSIIDIGHANMNGLDLPKFLAEHGNRIKAYHFHNNNGIGDQHNDIFDGTFDFKVFSALYKRFTPDASIVLEYEPHVGLFWDEIMERISFIRENFQ